MHSDIKFFDILFEDLKLNTQIFAINTSYLLLLRKTLTVYSTTPGGIRTPNLRFRRPTLYPIELQAHNFFKL